MIYSRLGNSGLKVSRLGFGNYLINYTKEQEEKHSNIIKYAYDRGLNFFNTSELYESGEGERQFGRIFKAHKFSRESLVIGLTLFFGDQMINNQNVGPNDRGTFRKRLHTSIHRSLENLQMEYVDVVFLHRFDEDTPVEEAVRSVNEIIERGQALYWGTSEWTPAQIGEAMRVADRLKLIKPITEQRQYSMLCRDKIEHGMRYLFEKEKYGAITYSPLAFGLLSGKYNVGTKSDGGRLRMDDPYIKSWLKARGIQQINTQEDGEQNKLQESLIMYQLTRLEEVAKKCKCTQAQLALAWVLATTDVSCCLLGATKIEQIKENLDAVEVLKKWTPELEAELNEILGNLPEKEMNWTVFPPQEIPHRRELTLVKP